MRKLFVFVLMSGLSFSIAHTAHASVDEVNCFWKESEGPKSFNAEDTINSFENCSFFIRGMLLGGKSGEFGLLQEHVLQGAVEGQLTFINPEDGRKTVCTVARKKLLSRLNGQEVMANYLSAILGSPAMSPEDLEKVQSKLQELNEKGVVLKDVREKIDKNISVSCGPVS